jgi:hypothetical protein
MIVCREKPVNAKSLADVALELERPRKEIERAARMLGFYPVPLGVAGELYVSPLAVPLIARRLGVIL